MARSIAEGQHVASLHRPCENHGAWRLAPVVLWLGLTASAPAAAPEPAPEPTRIGAFVTSLSDIQESQRRFDITLWVWLLSPPGGASDPAPRWTSPTSPSTVTR